jgi:two-component system, sensor histidine kinase and response regulator
MASDLEGGADLLLVDDQAPNLEVLAQVLGQAGHHVRAVSSGERALEVVRARPPECILMDVAMPGLSGFETCRILRQLPDSAVIPVLFLTASDELPMRLEGFRSGGQDYITKPFQAAEVLARVSVHVALFRAQRALSVRNEELEGARARLRELISQRARLSAMVVHDIKSPLTVIRCALDELEGEAEVVSDARAASEKIQRMVHELLELYRTDSIPANRDAAPLDLGELIRTAANAAELVGRQRGISMVVEGLDAHARIAGDRAKIDRVLANLLDNAIKFSPDGGTISVNLFREAGVGVEQGLDFAGVSVKDEGKGIPADQLPFVFDPYFQGSDRRPDGSVGLGLSIVRRLTAEHGGRVRVRSQLGVGTEFQILLPI